ncbi:MAG: transcriptional regulator [Planctomycetota bacterium]|nr:MAG: transcriptional regulator [Planctomycetota bacterium]
MQRLTDQELLLLLNDLESDRTERKESFQGDAPRKAREAVCAFANDLPNHNQPGVLFIGARDDGEPSGLKMTDELLRNLSDMKSDGNILPLPVLSVEKRLLKGMEMAVLTVMPSDMPPVKYKGRIWIRTGPRRSIANAQEERVLNERRRHKDLPFDIYPVTTAEISNLSRSIFENEYLPQAFAEDVLEQNDRTYEERLASCRIVASLENPTPTVMGLLAVGKSPQDFLPGAFIQFLRIDGIELADPVVDQEEFNGSIADMLRQAEEKLRAHNRRAFDITSAPRHQVSMPYPMAAIQQILYNAVLHRTYESTNTPIRVHWYNDRIEIISPGGPFGNVTSENFGVSGITDYRNPNIADVLKIFGYVQAFGRGIAIARRAMKENGNPEIEFNTTQSVVECVLRGKA